MSLAFFCSHESHSNLSIGLEFRGFPLVGAGILQPTWWLPAKSYLLILGVGMWAARKKSDVEGVSEEVSMQEENNPF